VISSSLLCPGQKSPLKLFLTFDWRIFMLRSSNTSPIPLEAIISQSSGITPQLPQQPQQEVPSSNPLQQTGQTDEFTRRLTEQPKPADTPDWNGLSCGLLLDRKPETTTPVASQQNWLQGLLELACGLGGR
jgi:hypothetical protein